MGFALLSLFISNNLIGWLGSLYERMHPAEFWALHALIAGAGSFPRFRHGAEAQASTPVRLFVVADTVPGALPRVLERFEGLNLVPCRVIAEHGDDVLRIEVDIADCPPRVVEQVAAELAQMPSIHSAICRCEAVEMANVAGRATHGSTI